jgi:hypothetical protein
MTIAEMIYQHCLTLPESAAREVLDFIEHRYGRSATQATEDEQKRQAALAHIAVVRIHWHEKPIADRDALYDDARV